MAWYGVHVIMVVRFKSGKQTSFPAWENVYLIQAADPKEAESKATDIGRANEGDSSGTFQWKKRPARWEFAGIRKTIEISDTKARENTPADGVEVTYHTLEFDEEKDLKKYAAGESVTVRAID